MFGKNPKSVHEAIVRALQKWVERHPNPDVPAMSIATSGQFTPRQLLQAVCDRSETGVFVEEMIEAAVAANEVELDDILNRFEESASVVRSA
jgi:hypothetical protein